MEEIILKNKDGKIWASSLDVAEKFGKEHLKVKRSIQALQKKMSPILARCLHNHIMRILTEENKKNIV